jgi:hypothetical protein
VSLKLRVLSTRQLTTRDPVDVGLLNLVRTTPIGCLTRGVPASTGIRLLHFQAIVEDARCTVAIAAAFPDGNGTRCRRIGPLTLIAVAVPDNTSVWRANSTYSVGANEWLTWTPSVNVNAVASIVPDSVVFRAKGDFSLLVWAALPTIAGRFECFHNGSTVACVVNAQAPGMRMWKYAVRVTEVGASVRFRLGSGQLLQGCRLLVRKI